ncbi:hypothetical protein QE152_g1691 [Popillia japonica]|uniref:Uncharacterized protein n=1 Tax=Popillia japonica TaxID=7064 RepID=A0AAW1N3U3_POPJA
MESVTERISSHLSRISVFTIVLSGEEILYGFVLRSSLNNDVLINARLSARSTIIAPSYFDHESDTVRRSGDFIFASRQVPRGKSEGPSILERTSNMLRFKMFPMPKRDYI